MSQECDTGTVLGATRLNLVLGLSRPSKLVLRSACVEVPMSQLVTGGLDAQAHGVHRGTVLDEGDLSYSIIGEIGVHGTEPCFGLFAGVPSAGDVVGQVRIGQRTAIKCDHLSSGWGQTNFEPRLTRGAGVRERRNIVARDQAYTLLPFMVSPGK